MTWLAMTLALTVGAASCSGSSDAGRQPTTTGAAGSTTTRPGQVLSTSTTARPTADLKAAQRAVAAAREQLPYPDDVLDCLASRASADADLLSALEKPNKGENLATAQAAAAACVVEVRSGPRFAEDLQRAAGGKLSKEQLSCAAEQYGRLSPEEIEAAAGAVLNPEKADEAALAPVEEIYETCGIERGDG